MKKVLLATTALFVVFGISAASADISVSAANEFKYKSWTDSYADDGSENNASFSNTTSYKISATTVTDNGLTMSSYTGQDGSTGAFDDYGFSVMGDFGTIGFQGSEAGDKFATATDVTPDESNSLDDAGSIQTVLPGDEHVDGSTISYLSPMIGSFQFSIGMKDKGGASDSTQFGGQYSVSSGDAAVTLKYAQDSGYKAASTDTERKATSLGLVVDYGDVAVTLADNTLEDVTGDFGSQSIGVTYDATDSLTLSAYTGSTSDNMDATSKMTDTGLGLSYTITSGLVFNVTHNDWSLKDVDPVDNSANGSMTSFALNLTF